MFIGLVAFVAVISAIEVVALAQKGTPIGDWLRPISTLSLATGWVLSLIELTPRQPAIDPFKIRALTPKDWISQVLTIVGIAGFVWTMLR